MQLKRLASAGFMALLASKASAVPNYLTTTLPVEDAMFSDPDMKETLEFLPALTVYQDSNDPNKYYYLPPFRAVSGVAATAMVNDSQIERSDEIKKTITQLYGPSSTARFTTLQTQYLAVMDKISKTTDPKLLEVLNQVAAVIQAAYEKAKIDAEDASKLIPAGIKANAYEYITLVLAQAGFVINNPQDLGERNTKISQLNRSNGGIFTANVFGGFYGNEAALVSKWHAARAKAGLPKISVSLLPAESFTWNSLAETVAEEIPNSGSGIPNFRAIKGGGNFVGSTINADLTVDGARKFKLPLQPLILPVYATATLIEKYPTFKASVKCDFTAGWSVKGRTDVRDGLIIYNNDITTNIVAKDIASNGEPCVMKFEGGGGDAVREAAYRKTIETVQNRIADLFVERSNMALADKKAYFNAVMADVQANRHTGANDGWAGVATSYLTGGMGGVFIGAASQASRFYWHTNKQNVESISTFKWEQQIIDDGNTKLTQPLPVQICVAYNPAFKAYTACSREEAATATSMSDASNQAEKSPECVGTTTTADCATAIVNDRPTNPDTGNVLPPEL